MCHNYNILQSATLPTTVGSRSIKTARGTCLPAPVSLKNVLNESSPPPIVLSEGICPSGWRLQEIIELIFAKRAPKGDVEFLGILNSCTIWVSFQVTARWAWQKGECWVFLSFLHKRHLFTAATSISPKSNLNLIFLHKILLSDLLLRKCWIYFNERYLHLSNIFQWKIFTLILLNIFR